MLYRVHEVRVVSEDFKLKFNSYCLKADGNSMVIASGGPNIQDLVRNFSMSRVFFPSLISESVGLPKDFSSANIPSKSSLI